MKRVLTIAGSDSGGGAGVQADLKVITVLGAYGMSVITALTAQNTLEVRGVEVVSPEFVRSQMDCVLSDIGADAAKTGMLATPEIVEVVARGIRDHNIETLVVDPVMVAKSGDRLLTEDSLEVVKRELIPLALVVTPNIPEASALTGLDIEGPKGMEEAARALHAMGAKNVVIKGGHLEGDALDLLFDGRSTYWKRARRIHTGNTHGTGCVFSAALATFLAQGNDVVSAFTMAKEFVTRAILSSLPLGKGSGPTNPYVEVQRWKEREAVLEELRLAMERLEGAPLGELIPEVRSNLGYALPGAVDKGDVAAFPGRITQIGKKVMACKNPAFGASNHIAKVILAAMRHDPGMRSAMNIRFGEDVLEACRRAGFLLASFDRKEEPQDVKEMEGSTLEWGTHKAISSLGRVPDAIYDMGEVGKEPMIRILGRTPMEVVEKVISLI
jgi:hydroxymethylpyrimidine kinase/phosphomethylpyrimidine kinase